MDASIPPYLIVRRPTLSWRTRVACVLVRALQSLAIDPRLARVSRVSLKLPLSASVWCLHIPTSPTGTHGGPSHTVDGRSLRASLASLSVAAWPPHDRWRRRLTSSRSLSSHGRRLASSRCRRTVAAWPPHDRWRRRLTSSRSLSSHGRCLASSRSLASPPDLLAFAVVARSLLGLLTIAGVAACPPRVRCRRTVAAWPPHDRWRRRLTSSRLLLVDITSPITIS